MMIMIVVQEPGCRGVGGKTKAGQRYQSEEKDVMEKEERKWRKT
jgi:hypothetical protein